MQLHHRHYEILRAMTEQWAPGHWTAKKLRKHYLPNVAKDLNDLKEAGYVKRDKIYLTKSKHSAWSRTPKADELLKEKLQRSKTSFEHQILDDMDTMSLQFGVDADPKFTLDRWPTMVLEGIVPQSTLDLIRQGKSPHHVIMKQTPHAFQPDGNGPLRVNYEDWHIYTIKEITRNTEQGRETAKSSKRQTWTWKIRNIRSFVLNKYWKTHYGFDCIFIRVISVSEQEASLIKDIIQEEIGPCKYIGVAAWKDWGNHDIEHGGEEKYPPPDGWSFTTPYERVGNPPYLLNKFYEMDR